MKSNHKRRVGILPTAGLIVEGDTEYEALPFLHTKKLIPGCPPLRVINLGGVGSHVDPIGIARMVKPKVIQHQAAGRSPIIVCIDREQRTTSATELAASVRRDLCSFLEKENRSSANVGVMVADRTFEAWILADARGLHKRRVFLHPPTFRTFEGEMGKDHKKGLVELSSLLGRPYGKTTDGPQLFGKVAFSDARKHSSGDYGSRSLDEFLRALGV